MSSNVRCTHFYYLFPEDLEVPDGPGELPHGDVPPRHVAVLVLLRPLLDDELGHDQLAEGAASVGVVIAFFVGGGVARSASRDVL